MTTLGPGPDPATRSSAPAPSSARPAPLPDQTETVHLDAVALAGQTNQSAAGRPPSLLKLGARSDSETIDVPRHAAVAMADVGQPRRVEAVAHPPACQPPQPPIPIAQVGGDRPPRSTPALLVVQAEPSSPLARFSEQIDVGKPLGTGASSTAHELSSPEGTLPLIGLRRNATSASDQVASLKDAEHARHVAQALRVHGAETAMARYHGHGFVGHGAQQEGAWTLVFERGAGSLESLAAADSAVGGQPLTPRDKVVLASQVADSFDGLTRAGIGYADHGMKNMVYFTPSASRPAANLVERPGFVGRVLEQTGLRSATTYTPKTSGVGVIDLDSAHLPGELTGDQSDRRLTPGSAPSTIARAYFSSDPEDLRAAQGNPRTYVQVAAENLLTLHTGKHLGDQACMESSLQRLGVRQEQAREAGLPIPQSLSPVDRASVHLGIRQEGLSRGKPEIDELRAMEAAGQALPGTTQLVQDGLSGAIPNPAEFSRRCLAVAGLERRDPPRVPRG